MTGLLSAFHDATVRGPAAWILEGSRHGYALASRAWRASGTTGFALAAIAGSSFAVDVDRAVGAAASPARLFEAPVLFSAYDVAFVMINRERPREFEWFTNDDDRYRILYENPSVVLFEVFR